MCCCSPDVRPPGLRTLFVMCTRLNGKHVVFGTVINGFRTLRAIEDAGTLDGQPACKIEIVDCGEILPETDEDPPDSAV